MDAIWQDVKFAARGLRSRPGFTALAVVTLMLGIGANVAIFSVVDGVVFRALPYESPDRLVRIWPDSLFPSSLGDALYLEEHATSLDGVAAWGRSLFLVAGETPQEVRGAVVDPGHFDVLGAPPRLGRGFLPEDGAPGAPPVVILGHGLWQRRFGSDPAVVGRQVEISGRPRTVVGVVGPEHQPIEEDWQMWAPLTRDLQGPDAGRPMAINARLAAGSELETAQEEVRALLTRLWLEQGRDIDGAQMAKIKTVPLRSWLLGDADRRLLFLLGAVALVLLIACINVGNLLLARGGGRRHELNLRMAIGAGRARLMRLLLTESLLLGTLGGGLGLLLGGALLRLGVPHMPAEIPRSHAVALDLRVLGFAAAVSLVTALVFGLAPAWRLIRGADLGLRTRGDQTPGAAWFSHALVAGEVALAVMVVAGAGLMVKSFATLAQVDPGFEASKVVALKPAPPLDRYDSPEKMTAYYQQVYSAVEALPVVESTGAIQFLPMKPGGAWYTYSTTDQRRPGENLPGVSMRVVTPGYFKTMGIPLRRGRDFAAQDTADSPTSLVINRTFAEIVWPGEDPVGRSLFFGRSEPFEATVVGVVGDVRQRRLGEAPMAEAYQPFAQNPWPRMYITARVSGDPEAAVPRVREAVLSVDPKVSLDFASPLAEVVGSTTASSRFLAALLSAFGALALLLGAVGVYGVTAHAVIRRRREFGIRMSVGARPQDVLGAAVKRGLWPIASGLLTGLVGWLAVSHWLDGLLYEVTSTDAAVLGQVLAVLAAVSVFALVTPARRASRIDPMIVLRED